MEVWISELQVFNHNKSLILSQGLPDMIASVIKVCVKPFDLSWASLGLLSAVRSAAMSISTSQSSKCVVSCSLNTGIYCSKEVVRLVCFLAEHRVFMQCHIISPKGSVGAGGWSAIESFCSLHSMWLKVTVGCPSPIWTHRCKSSISLVRSVSFVGLLCLRSSNWTVSAVVKSLVSSMLVSVVFWVSLVMPMSPFKGHLKPPWWLAIAWVLYVLQ